MEFQAPNGVAVVYGAFNRDADQMLRWAALWKFRAYWSLVGPFSGLMRKAILKQVKTEAESTFTWAIEDR